MPNQSMKPSMKSIKKVKSATSFYTIMADGRVEVLGMTQCGYVLPFLKLKKDELT